MTGRGYQSGRRVKTEVKVRLDLELSDRHREWGTECPAVDLDFMMCEYNHGVSVALVEYKHHTANLSNSNDLNYAAISELYLKDGRQIPLFVARYWPDIWAFRTKAYNQAAVDWAVASGIGWDGDWRPQSERQFVTMLYQLRKDVLTLGDQLTIARLNADKPPLSEEKAS